MALGSIPFTVKDIAAVSRAGADRTLASMRFPVCVPLRFDEAKLNTSTFRVVDTTTSQAVPAAFRVGTRWGDRANTAHRLKTVWVDLLPSIDASEERTFQLQTTGGTGNSTGGITVSTQPAYFEINTGNPGITVRIPRTGPQSVMRYLKDNATNREIINGDLSGLWITGGPSGGAQSGEYRSRLDVTGTGADNGGVGNEIVPPTDIYYTSILDQNSQRVRIKIDNVRLRNTAGTAFQGLEKAPTHINNGTVAPRDARFDVYLTVFRNSRAIHTQVVCRSTGGGHTAANSSLRSDMRIHGFGLELVTTYSGTSTLIATRDETAAGKVARATATANQTLHQVAHPAQLSTYNFALVETGPIAHTGTPTVQLEASFVAIQSDSSRALGVFPWGWRERYPMGWTYLPTSGTLRWEMLNTTSDDIQETATSGTPRTPDHWLLGDQAFHAEAWVVAFGENPSDATITATGRGLAGAHMNQLNDVYSNTTAASGAQPGPGQHIPSLLGRCGPDHWDDTRAWKRVAPAQVFDLPVSLRQGALALAGDLPGRATKFGDALERWDRKWLRGILDDTAPDNSTFGSFISTFNRPGGADTQFNWGPEKWYGWRTYWCLPSVAGLGMAPNDYECTGLPLTHYLRTGNHGYFAHGFYGVIHYTTIDQSHVAPSQLRTSSGVSHGQAITGRSTGRQYHNNFFDQAGQEYQQQFESIVWWWVHTGEDFLFESMQRRLEYFNTWFYGESDAGYCDFRWRGSFECDITTANVLRNIRNVVGTLPTGRPGIKGSIRAPGFLGDYPVPGSFGTTLSSSGNRFTFSSPISLVNSGGPGTTNTMNVGLLIGAQIRVPRTTGAVYRVIAADKGTAGFNTSPFNNPSALTRFVDVSPTPPSPITNQLWEYVECLHGGTTVALSGTLSGDTVSVQFNDIPGGISNRTNVRIRSYTSGALRREGHELIAVVSMAKALGSTMTTQSGTHNLYERIRDAALWMVNCEQQFSSPEAIAGPMGGGGVWIGGADLLSNEPYITHGAAGHQNNTSASYVMPAIQKAHEFMDTYRVHGITATFTAADCTALLNLGDRACKANFMGVDGNSRLMGPNTQARRLPFLRGGDVASPTSWQPLLHPTHMAVVEEPTRRTRITECYEDGNALTTMASHSMYTFDPIAYFLLGKNLGGNFQLYGPDLLTWVAEKKYHPGNPTVRDAYLRMALECFQQVATKFEIPAFSATYGMYIDPRTFGQARTFIAANMANAGSITVRHALLRGMDIPIRRALEGWGGGGEPADTTPPTETQLLALSNKTDTRITVDGPPATDNVAVVDYLFFKDGVQDGPAQVGTSHTYTNLTPGQTYSLKRQARDAVPNTSTDSNTLSIRTDDAADTTPPTVPTGLEGETTTTTATLRWLPSTDEESGVGRYVIERNGVVIGEVIP